MAVKPICDICDLEMDEFGAILLSPPDNDDFVHKYHICIYCYKLLKEKNNLD